jgi:hypothetical protein
MIIQPIGYSLKDPVVPLDLHFCCPQNLDIPCYFFYSFLQVEKDSRRYMEKLQDIFIWGGCIKGDRKTVKELLSYVYNFYTFISANALVKGVLEMIKELEN